jgi:hypothetical protein
MKWTHLTKHSPNQLITCFSFLIALCFPSHNLVSSELSTTLVDKKDSSNLQNTVRTLDSSIGIRVGVAWTPSYLSDLETHLSDEDIQLSSETTLPGAVLALYAGYRKYYLELELMLDQIQTYKSNVDDHSFEIMLSSWSIWFRREFEYPILTNKSTHHYLSINPGLSIGRTFDFGISVYDDSGGQKIQSAPDDTFGALGFTLGYGFSTNRWNGIIFLDYRYRFAAELASQPTYSSYPHRIGEMNVDYSGNILGFGVQLGYMF